MSSEDRGLDITLDTTLVTAFVSIARTDGIDLIDRYITTGKRLLAIDVPKVVYIESRLSHLFLPTDDRTVIVPIERDRDLRWWDTARHVDTVLPASAKDSPTYCCIINNKTGFVRRAIELNPHATSRFAWVDFGILYIDSTEGFEDAILAKIQRLERSSFDGVVLPGCWNPSRPYQIDPFRQLCWYFCGGFFAGPRDRLIEFDDLASAEYEDALINRGINLHDVNVWYLAYRKRPDLFCWYAADHNISMFA